MEKIGAFSEVTQQVLKLYVFVLKDKLGRVLFVGQGQGNRVFESVLKSKYYSETELAQKSAEIKAMGDEVTRYIIAHNLNKHAADAIEEAFINFFEQDREHLNLPDFGTVSGPVEDIERLLGYETCRLHQVRFQNDYSGKILFVKVPIGLGYESITHSSQGQLLDTLKNKTLSWWRASRESAKQVRYVVGVATHSGGAIVSAYEISAFELDGSGRARYYANHRSSREVLELLSLYKKRIPQLHTMQGPKYYSPQR